MIAISRLIWIFLTKQKHSYLKKNPTVFMGSSGRPVAQSMTVWMPTNVAGMVSGLLRSACSKNTSNISYYIQESQKK